CLASWRESCTCKTRITKSSDFCEADMKPMRIIPLAGAFSLLLAFVPQSGWTQVRVERRGNDTIYKLSVNVVERSTPAVNYRGRSGETFIDFRGTNLLPEARGSAKVESKHGYEQIVVDFDKLQPASRFGPEYLTYVMWAITPEGRAINLGELVPDGDHGHLNVTTDMQSF